MINYRGRQMKDNPRNRGRVEIHQAVEQAVIAEESYKDAMHYKNLLADLVGERYPEVVERYLPGPASEYSWEEIAAKLKQACEENKVG